MYRKREAGGQFWTSPGRARAAVDTDQRRTPARTVMWPNGGRGGQDSVLSLEVGVHSRCTRGSGRGGGCFQQASPVCAKG